MLMCLCAYARARVCVCFSSTEQLIKLLSIIEKKFPKSPLLNLLHAVATQSGKNLTKTCSNIALNCFW